MLFPNGEWDGVSEVETVTVESAEEESAKAVLGYLPIWSASADRPAGKAPLKAPKFEPAAPPPGYDDPPKKKLGRPRKEDANRNDADR